jgi:hypothetical protein
MAAACIAGWQEAATTPFVSRLLAVLVAAPLEIAASLLSDAMV